MPKSSTSDTSSEEHLDPPRILDLGVKTTLKEQKEWIPPRSVVEKAYIKACSGVSLDKVGQLRRLIELVFLVDNPSRYLVSQFIGQVCGFNIATGPGQQGTPQQWSSEETGTSSSSEDESSSSEDEEETSSSDSETSVDTPSTSSTSETSTSSSSETSTSSDPEEEPEPEPEEPELVDLEDLASEPPPATTLFD